MRILYLAEGDPASRLTWSGIARSVVTQLQGKGFDVRTGDVDLKGIDRWLTAAQTFVPDRKRWGVRYRVGGLAFNRRSARATNFVDNVTGWPDAILQNGATFRVRGYSQYPRFLYCDSNIGMAAQGVASGHSPANWLTERELQAVWDREISIYRSAEMIFAISERLRRSFIEEFGISEERVVTIYAGPNFDEAKLLQVARTDFIERGQEGGNPRILFVGAQFERKGGEVLLEAFRRVRARMPEAELTIVGPDRKAAEQEGVQHLGYLNKESETEWRRLVEAYRSADVFCLPTRYEPFGVAFIEAMWFGLPCIGTEVSAVPEIIKNGETGFVVATDDAAAVSSRLLSLLENRSLSRRMGAAGRARAQQIFSWDVVGDRMARQISARIDKGAEE